MKPLRRILAAAAILSCVAAAVFFAVLWRRSYTSSDYLARLTPATIEGRTVTHTAHYVTWTTGRIRLYRETDHYYTPLNAPPPTTPAEPPPRRAHWTTGNFPADSVSGEPLYVDTFWNRLGFHRYHRGMATSWSDTIEDGIAIPAGLPVLLFSIPPLLWFVAIVRGRRRRRRNLCPACAYDLRHSPTRCPECGIAVSDGRSV